MSFVHVHKKKRKEKEELKKKKHQDNMSVRFFPLTPHFCIVKLGFTGVYIIFLCFAMKHKF